MFVARLWVDCFDYQSNTVILAALVFRGQPQPVHNLACNKHKKTPKSYEIGVFLCPLWQAFVVFCTVFCGSVVVLELRSS